MVLSVWTCNFLPQPTPCPSSNLLPSLSHPHPLLPQAMGPAAANPATDPSTIPLEPPGSAPLSQRLCRLLAHLRAGQAGCYALAYAVRQGTPVEAHVLPMFVEDRAQGQFGYGDFLHQLHRGVMNK